MGTKPHVEWRDENLNKRYFIDEIPFSVTVASGAYRDGNLIGVVAFCFPDFSNEAEDPEPFLNWRAFRVVSSPGAKPVRLQELSAHDSQDEAKSVLD